MTNKIIYDMPEEEYFAVEAFSFSGAKALAKSPADYKHYKTTKQKPNSNREFWKAIHAALLQPEEYVKRLTIIDGHGGSTEVKEAKAAARNENRFIINSEKSHIINTLWKNFYNNTKVMEIMEDAKTEVSLFWEENDVKCKARLDILSPLGIFDIKNYNGNFDPNSLSRYIAMETNKYHWQLCHYVQGAAACGLNVLPCGIIFVEPELPGKILKANMLDAALEKAHQELLALKCLYHNCIKNDNWPLTMTEEIDVSLPYYAF